LAIAIGVVFYSVQRFKQLPYGFPVVLIFTLCPVVAYLAVTSSQQLLPIAYYTVASFTVTQFNSCLLPVVAYPVASFTVVAYAVAQLPFFLSYFYCCIFCLIFIFIMITE
jgi:hypothetical protein